MGMAPAPSIANLFVAIYEATHIVTFPTTILPFIRRFIDDGFGIWLRDNDPAIDATNWENFQQLVNAMGLTWEFSPRSTSVTFMDLNIHLERGRLTTSIYAKPLALHLYIPPMSCHAPGVLTGLIHGHFHRLFTLCSHESDIEQEIYNFYNRLIDRGYSLPMWIPIFLTAEQIAREKQARTLLPQGDPPNHQLQDDTQTGHTSRTLEQDGNVFLHLQYHLANPPTSVIQKLWRRHVLTPPNETPLSDLRNRYGQRVNIRKLTVAYSRVPNLGNLLSCRKLQPSTPSTDDHPMTTREQDQY